MMSRDNQYFVFYLVTVFGLWWGTALCFYLNPALMKFTGTLSTLHPLIIFFSYLPSITGLMIYYWIGHATALKGIVSQLVPRKETLFWFPCILIGFVFFVFFMHFGTLLLGMPLPSVTYTIPQMIAEGLANFIRETGIVGGVFGWVAFLLPWFQEKLKHHIAAGLLTGLLFGLWLFPGFALSSASGNISYVLYVIQLMAFFVFQSYIFNATKGSLIFYLLTFGLISAGSHIQLYYFNVPTQLMQIALFSFAALLSHVLFKKYKIDAPLQTLKMLTSVRINRPEAQCEMMRSNLTDDA